MINAIAKQHRSRYGKCEEHEFRAARCENKHWLTPHQSRPTDPVGPVRDLVDVYFAFADWHFPIFNVADACISVGAVVLVVSGLAAGERETDEGPAATPDPAALP